MLTARNISYAWGEKPLFSDISFALKEGETLVVRGTNGSGKSTLLRLVAGLIQIPPSTLFWRDIPLSKGSLADYQQELLYVGHKLALYQDACLKDQIRLWQNVSRETLGKALHTWEVGHLLNKKISQLSQGQQKRISLSRCSSFQKRIWILDEPTAGLDEDGKAILDECLNHHLNGGGCVMMATHEGDSSESSSSILYLGRCEERSDVAISSQIVIASPCKGRGNPFFYDKDGLPRRDSVPPRNDESGNNVRYFRELRILNLQRGTLFGALGFFALALFSAALSLGPDTKILQLSAPALIWILAILTTLFSTPHHLKREAQEGLLDEIILRSSPPAFSILAKIGAEYVCLGIPLILVSALLSSLFSLSMQEILTLSATLAIGFPALSALGLWGGLLIVHSQGGGILLALLILPLTMPLILFSLSASHMTRLGLDSFPSFCLLTSVSLLLVIVSVAAGTKALRLAVEG